MPRGAPQLPELQTYHPGVECVGFVERDDLRLARKAVTVEGELLADRAISVGDIFEGAVDQVEDHQAALDMTEKAGADPGTLAGTLDQPGEVRQHELLVMQPHDPEGWLLGRERVVGDLGLGVRDGGEEGRLTCVGQTDETDIGDEL